MNNGNQYEYAEYLCQYGGKGDVLYVSTDEWDNKQLSKEVISIIICDEQIVLDKEQVHKLVNQLINFINS